MPADVIFVGSSDLSIKKNQDYLIHFFNLINMIYVCVSKASYLIVFCSAYQCNWLSSKLLNGNISFQIKFAGTAKPNKMINNHELSCINKVKCMMDLETPSTGYTYRMILKIT